MFIHVAFICKFGRYFFFSFSPQRANPLSPFIRITSMLASCDCLPLKDWQHQLSLIWFSVVAEIPFRSPFIRSFPDKSRLLTSGLVRWIRFLGCGWLAFYNSLSNGADWIVNLLKFELVTNPSAGGGMGRNTGREKKQPRQELQQLQPLRY